MFHVERIADETPLPLRTTERLQVLTGLVVRWARTVNLVSPADLPHLWRRHVDDSLQLIRDFRNSPSHAIDLGSGAGFPGLVLAIATETYYHLIESDKRKAAFLREAIRLTGAPAVVHAVRIERAAIEPAPIITARAVASLEQLLAWAAPLLAPGGICVFPKGRLVEQELAEATRAWHMSVEQRPSRTDPAGTILKISNLSRA